MIDNKICEWLIENADAPVKYRVAKELIKDEKTAKKFESELFENDVVQKWLENLKPDNSRQCSHNEMIHGSFDFCLENSMAKAVKLGLHADFPQTRYAVSCYIDVMKGNYIIPYRNRHNGFSTVMVANYLCFAGFDDESIIEYMLGSLDEMYAFVRRGTYDIYITPKERDELKGIPDGWKDREDFIKPELVAEYGFCYPIIHDIMGLHRLYNLNNPDVDRKINAVLNYFTNDDFHTDISNGYGILTAGKRVYHSMGWSPHYPGWFDVAYYVENSDEGSAPNGAHTENRYIPKLLSFAENIAKYPIAVKTKWFSDLLCCLEKYKIENGIYAFPKKWLTEKKGYAVGGHHLSFGENRRKKNWVEIESTFYMQLLQQNM